MDDNPYVPPKSNPEETPRYRHSLLYVLGVIALGLLMAAALGILFFRPLWCGDDHCSLMRPCRNLACQISRRLLRRYNRGPFDSIPG